MHPCCLITVSRDVKERVNQILSAKLSPKKLVTVRNLVDILSSRPPHPPAQKRVAQRPMTMPERQPTPAAAPDVWKGSVPKPTRCSDPEFGHWFNAFQGLFGLKCWSFGVP